MNEKITKRPLTDIVSSQELRHIVHLFQGRIQKVLFDDLCDSSLSDLWLPQPDKSFLPVNQKVAWAIANYIEMSQDEAFRAQIELEMRRHIPAPRDINETSLRILETSDSLPVVLIKDPMQRD